MIYLIIQIGNNKPSIIYFQKLEDAKQYATEEFGSDFMVGITDNVYIIHLKGK